MERWLSELPDGDWAAGRLPSAVLSVAGRDMRSAEYRQTEEIAVARVLSTSQIAKQLLVSEHTVQQHLRKNRPVRGGPKSR